MKNTQDNVKFIRPTLANIKEGTIVSHFKGGVYEVLLMAKDVDTLEPVVVYRSLHNHTVWVRPFNIFSAKIDKDMDGNLRKQDYRFVVI